jgi:hypothetical protein
MHRVIVPRHISPSSNRSAELAGIWPALCFSPSVTRFFQYTSLTIPKGIAPERVVHA